MMRCIGTDARKEGWGIAVSIGAPGGRNQLENLRLRSEENIKVTHINKVLTVWICIT
jgi:hypothetical protein